MLFRAFVQAPHLCSFLEWHLATPPLPILPQVVVAPHKVLGVIIVLPEVLGAGAEPLGVATEEEGVGWAGERVGVSLTIPHPATPSTPAT